MRGKCLVQNKNIEKEEVLDVTRNDTKHVLTYKVQSMQNLGRLRYTLGVTHYHIDFVPFSKSNVLLVYFV